MWPRLNPALTLGALGKVGPSGSHHTRARGLAVLNSPVLNKGTAFTAEERTSLGLTGLLPPEVNTLETQVKRTYIQYELLPDALSRSNYLSSLHDRNEVLFHRLLSEHLREMIPIVNDMSVLQTLERNQPEGRRPRGLYLSIDHPGEIDQAFSSLGAVPEGIDLLVATDAERILGVGDWGVGGIEVAIAKLAIYCAAGGLDPGRMVPVMLDVGTDRQQLLDDPTYTGNRHPRIRGARYDEFIEAYVAAAMKWFPSALLHWEDFSPGNGRRILENYRDRTCTFNDDMQGTGAITLAAVISAVRVCGTALRNQRIVIFGSGAAGVGIADQIRDAMVRDGLTASSAATRFWCLDREGLLIRGMDLQDYQLPYARPAMESKNWNRAAGGIRLAEVVHRVKPTILIGVSNTAGAFTEPIVREMAAHTERPIIFALSNPLLKAEARPADLIAWTEGRGLLAMGSPFNPVTYKGVTYVIAHVINSLLYPGLGLGIIVSKARRISPGMLAAAASAVSSLVTVRQPGASLLPQMDDLRSVAATVAVAVAEAAEADGLARGTLTDIVQQVQDAMWQLEYRPIHAA